MDLSEDVAFFRETSLLVWLGGSRGVSGESELEIGGCCWQLASQVGWENREGPEWYWRVSSHHQLSSNFSKTARDWQELRVTFLWDMSSDLQHTPCL